MIDYPTYGHLGKKIKFQDLNDECRRLLMEEYCEVWDIPVELSKEVEAVQVKLIRTYKNI